MTERSWIHSGEGFEANLVCVVHADPQPTVRDNFPPFFNYHTDQINCVYLAWLMKHAYIHINLVSLVHIEYANSDCEALLVTVNNSLWII